ncbi:MAG: hypothetical protein HYS87_00445 [Candidatus Colwellbacteria bacterium]|nr:hypothetical protein [Candidatus Colwellbacteria bacterium]
MQLKLDEFVNGLPIQPLPPERDEFLWFKSPTPIDGRYREIRIRKPKGGFRTLFAPSNELKITQQKILEFLKSLQLPITVDIYGLKSGSYVNHANWHAKARWIFQFDVADAFPSVSRERLESALFKAVLQTCKGALTKAELARLEHPNVNPDDILKGNLTPELEHDLKRYLEYGVPIDQALRILARRYGYDGGSIPNPPRSNKQIWQLIRGAENEEDLHTIARKLTEKILRFCIYKGALPQGAPTSPMLFYIYLAEHLIIRRMSQVLGSERMQSCKAEISCYVDGFVVSSLKPLAADEKEKLLTVLREAGFEVNPRKTRERDVRHGAVRITGLHVDGSGKVRLSKRDVRRWRATIHCAAISGDPKLRQRVEGFIASARAIYDDNLPQQLAKPYALLQARQPM